MTSSFQTTGVGGGMSTPKIPIIRIQLRRIYPGDVADVDGSFRRTCEACKAKVE